MITQNLEQAGRLTHDHNPTYTLALLGNLNDTNKKWHKTHFHSVFNAHAHIYWQIRQDTDHRVGNEHTDHE